MTSGSEYISLKTKRCTITGTKGTDGYNGIDGVPGVKGEPGVDGNIGFHGGYIKSDENNLSSLISTTHTPIVNSQLNYKQFTLEIDPIEILENHRYKLDLSIEIFIFESVGADGRDIGVNYILLAEIEDEELEDIETYCNQNFCTFNIEYTQNGEDDSVIAPSIFFDDDLYKSNDSAINYGNVFDGSKGLAHNYIYIPQGSYSYIDETAGIKEYLYKPTKINISDIIEIGDINIDKPIKCNISIYSRNKAIRMNAHCILSIFTKIPEIPE
jgi:hypothetical protein